MTEQVAMTELSGSSRAKPVAPVDAWSGLSRAQPVAPALALAKFRLRAEAGSELAIRLA